MNTNPIPDTVPIPVVHGRFLWRNLLAALAYEEYRRYAISWLCASTGMWIARVATDWLVLEITGDVALLGLLIALQLLPAMVLGTWGGVVSDWMQPRRTVVGTQVVLVGLFAWLAALVICGDIAPQWVFAIAVLIGVVTCVDWPSRVLLTAQTVDTAALPNAISVNAVLPQIGGVLGAGVAGVAILSVGVGWTLFAAAGVVLCGAAATFAIRPSRLTPRMGARPGRGQIREALSYVFRKPVVFISIVMVGVLAVSGLSGSVLFVWMAEEKFSSGASGYSLYTMLAACGAVAGGILSARRRRFTVGANAILLMLSGAVWIVCGLVPWATAFMASLVAAMVLRFLFIVANDTLVQLSVRTAIRGRVVSIYLMAVTGGQVIGSILLGWMVSRFGGELAFIVTGTAALVTGLVISLAALHSIHSRYVRTECSMSSSCHIAANKARPT